MYHYSWTYLARLSNSSSIFLSVFLTQIKKDTLRHCDIQRRKFPHLLFFISCNDRCVTYFGAYTKLMNGIIHGATKTNKSHIVFTHYLWHSRVLIKHVMLQPTENLVNTPQRVRLSFLIAHLRYKPREPIIAI